MVRATVAFPSRHPESARHRAWWWAAVMAVAVGLVGCTVATGSEPAPDGAPASGGPLESAPPEQPVPEAMADSLQATLETYLGTQDAPGVTAALVSTEGTWAGAAGVDGAGVPLEPESAFGIASITKTFVAAEVMLLSARGLVELDGPIDAHVELPFDTGGATVREVLGMESGFPVDPVEEVMALTGDLEREWTVEDVFALAPPRTRQGLRGGEPDYNNLNYYALGAMVEEVTGDPLAVALRRDLIDPAGLERVWVQTAEEPTPPVAVAVSAASGVAVDVDGPYLPSRALASAAGAAGGMAADAPTLARWGHLLYGGAAIDAALVSQMTAAEDEADWYGLGTLLYDDGEEVVVGHEGDIAVYHSLLAVWPGSETSVAVLVPGSPVWTLDEERTPFGLARALRHVVVGERTPPARP